MSRFDSPLFPKENLTDAVTKSEPEPEVRALWWVGHLARKFWEREVEESVWRDVELVLSWVSLKEEEIVAGLASPGRRSGIAAGLPGKRLHPFRSAPFNSHDDMFLL